MPKPRCMECKALWTWFRGYWKVALSCDECKRDVSQGRSEEEAKERLPKTSPDWCPKRKTNRPAPEH